ncbi:Helix-turn-helix domain protein [compost metagenome]
MNNNPCVERDSRVPASGAGRPAGLLVSNHTTTDIDDQAASLSGWEQIYDQLSPGRYQGSVTQCWIDDLQVIRESANQCVHQLGHSWEGCRTFIVPMRQQGVARFGSQVVEADVPVTLGPGQELDFRTPPALDVMSIALSAASIAELSVVTEGYDLEAVLGGCHGLRAEPSRLAELRTLLASVYEVIQHTPELLAYPEVRKGLRQSILLSLFATCSGAERPGRSQRALLHKRVVDKAREYVLENTLEPVTIASLCEVVGVSRRTLQMCFQEIMGTNPVQYLRAIRLNRVRRDLRQNQWGGLKVQDVACHWGFWHLSSFTADYKRMFGELPSQTLLRAR